MPYPFDYSCAEEAIRTLANGVLADFSLSAQEYSLQTGERLLVTSARRTLRHTAQLMAAFSREQLEGMYCRHGYPSYIRSLVSQMTTLKRQLTPDEVYFILCHRTEGFISSHLYGAALDIATAKLKNPVLLCHLLDINGFTTFNETDLGIACIHASHRATPIQIIKE